VPLEGTSNPALVCDFGKDWRFFLRDLQFDRAGRPVMLYILRHRRKALPAPESRIWSTSRWASREWETTGTLYSDQDYDAGCLLIERNLQYAVLPTDPGPRRNTAGGNLVRWRSEDQGRSWYPRPLTFDTDLNHNWVRHPQDGQPDFELIWADGNTRRPSESHLYCADAAGNVYLLPVTMSTDAAKPKRVWAAPAPASQPAATQSSAAGSAATSPAAVQVPASRPQ
jgi:hypothetical protein